MARKRPTARGEGSREPEARLAEGDAQGGYMPFYALYAFVTITLGYLLIFYRAEEARWAALAFIFAPDRLLEIWCGGQLEWFSIFDRWPVLVLTGVTLGGAWLAGRLALTLLGVNALFDRVERVVFALGVGLNLMSLFALAVGLAGGLRERWCFVGPLVVMVLGNLIVWYRSENSKPSPALRAPSPKGRGTMDDPAWYWWLAAALPFAAAIVLGGMLPPSAYDVREYHLQAPKEWFQNGAITFLPHNIYANMPLGSELNSVWAMALAGGKDGWWWGAITGKTIMACCSLVTAAALVGFGRRLHSLAAGIIAAVIYVSTPWIVSLAGVGYNEGPVAMFALLAIYAIWLANQQEQKTAAARLVALSGFCAGSAVTCKYPPLLFLVIPLALWIVVPSRVIHLVFPRLAEAKTLTPALSQRERGLFAGIFLAAAAVPCGPWFAKNAVQTGNPTYPLLYSIFDGATRTPEKDRQWTRVHSPQAEADGSRYSLASIGHQLTWLAYETKGASVAILPLAAMALLVRRTRKTVIALLIWMAYAFGTWWLLTHRLDRFLVLLLPIGALLAGIGAVALEQKSWRIATLLFVAWSLISQFPLCTLPILADSRYFAPLDALRRDDTELDLRGTRAELYLGGKRVDAAHKWLNAHVPEGERVLLVGDAEPFDLEVPAIYNTCFDDCQFAAIFEGKSRAERLAALKEKHISHVFISWTHLARYRSLGNYGYTSDYVTPDAVHRELIAEQHLLKKVPVRAMLDENGEMFEVVKE